MISIITYITFLLCDQSGHENYHSLVSFKVDIKTPRPDSKEMIQKQASRTAWNILCDLKEFQCSMILLGQAKPLQMFLSSMYDTKNNETLFDKVSSGKMKLLPG